MNKKQSTSQSAFFNLRTVIGLSVCLFGFVISLFAAGLIPGTSSTATKLTTGQPQAAPGSQAPDVVRMIGPVAQNLDLRVLPYKAPRDRDAAEVRLLRHPFPRPAVSSPKKTATTFVSQL